MQVIKREKLEFNNRTMTIQILHNEKLVKEKYYIIAHGECWCECFDLAKAHIIFYMLKDHLINEYFNNTSNFETVSGFDLNEPKFNN